MARITHPTSTKGRHYGHFGVIFDNGVADVELTDESRAWYAGRGYGIEQSEWAYCGLGVCAANDGHEGTCAEASGWDDVEEVVVLEGELDGTGDNLPEFVEGDGEKVAPARRSRRK